VTPGYGDEVIFADGTFIDGSTAELSADGPLRDPYVVYCQGGNALDALGARAEGGTSRHEGSETGAVNSTELLSINCCGKILGGQTS
jgi:hypothetical protein